MPLHESHYECRLLRHAWQMYSPTDDRRGTGVWRNALHLKCLRCGMTRHDAFDKIGGVLTRRYDPPEGYYLSKGEERPEVEQLRLWAVKRQRRLSASQADRTDQADRTERDARARRAAAEAL